MQALAAELACAAYGVALRHGARGAWVDLELDLWRALTEIVRRWDRRRRGGRPPEDEPARLCTTVRVGEDFSRAVGGG